MVASESSPALRRPFFSVSSTTFQPPEFLAFWPAPACPNSFSTPSASCFCPLQTQSLPAIRGSTPIYSFSCTAARHRRHGYLCLQVVSSPPCALPSTHLRSVAPPPPFNSSSETCRASHCRHSLALRPARPAATSWPCPLLPYYAAPGQIHNTCRPTVPL